MIGFTTLLNEIEVIEGWIRQALVFCNQVFVLLDPKSTSKTREFLVNLQKSLPFEIQDQKEYVETPFANWHENQNQFIKQYIKENEWFYFIDADERINPKDYDELLYSLDYVRDHNEYEAVCCNTKYEFYPDVNHIIDWGNVTLQQSIFMKKTNTLHRGLDPHCSFVIRGIKLIASCPLYHYSRLKEIKFKWWDEIETSDWKRIRDTNNIHVLPFVNPIPNWSDMK